jgi:CNT family concentrative nucleoside transporter
LKLALNVGAMLIAFIGLVAVLNWLLGPVGSLIGVEQLSLGMLLGWLFFPLAAVMGVESGEIGQLARLLGTKIAVNELIAYSELTQMKETLSPRTFTIASFALCGFANLGSVGIQIGGLGAMAPERRSVIARLALRAMFAGAMATFLTACIAGVML